MTRSWLAFLVLAGLHTGCQQEVRVASTALIPDRPESYASSAFAATVIDSETGAPVAGAAVAVIWRSVDAIQQGWAPELFRSVELRTDAQGAFSVEAWGPRTVEADKYLDARDPEIWIIKRGYLPGYFDQTGSFDAALFRAGAPIAPGKLSPRQTATRPHDAFARAAHQRCIWDGKRLPLTRASSEKERFRTLVTLNPTDRGRPGLRTMTLFWDEWLAAWQELPPALRNDKAFDDSPARGVFR